MSGGEMLQQVLPVGVGNSSNGNQLNQLSAPEQNDGSTGNLSWMLPANASPFINPVSVQYSTNIGQQVSASSGTAMDEQHEHSMSDYFVKASEVSVTDNNVSYQVHEVNDMIDSIVKQQSTLDGSGEMGFNSGTTYTNFSTSFDGGQQQVMSGSAVESSASGASTGFNDIAIKFEEKDIQLMRKHEAETSQQSLQLFADRSSSEHSFLNPSMFTSMAPVPNLSAPPEPPLPSSLFTLHPISNSADLQALDLPSLGTNLFSPTSTTTNFLDNPCSMSLDASEWLDRLSDELSNTARSMPALSAWSVPKIDEEFADHEIEEQARKTVDYWLHPVLPDENVMLGGAHVQMLCRIVPRYHWFVQLGTHVNRNLKRKFEVWSASTDGDKGTLSQWIQKEVVPSYTLMSCNYFRHLPGFLELPNEDKGILVRLGQSQSRILVAALHWYDPDAGNFRNFLSWRESRAGQVDVFKQKLLDYARRISCEEMDSIEAGLLNALVVIASDYPGLKNAAVIEKHRKLILGTFRAYTSAKFGTPNVRLERLFQYIPEVRQLGLLHYKMTTLPTLGVGNLAHGESATTRPVSTVTSALTQQ
jgi:hypothetical protein